MYSAANRDPEVFHNPETFCPERNGLGNHLAFGKGIHYCIGAPLSRLEGRVAAEELARRLRTISLPDTNSFEYHPSFMLRGLKTSRRGVQRYVNPGPQSVEVSGSGATYTVRVSGMNATGRVYAQVRDKAAVNPMGLPSSASNTAYTDYYFFC